MSAIGGNNNEFFEQKTSGASFDAKEAAQKNLDIGSFTGSLKALSKEGASKTLYLTKAGWMALSEDLVAQKKDKGEELIKFSKKDIKTLLATDNVVRQTLIHTSKYVDALDAALKVPTESPLQKALIKIGVKTKTGGIAEQHWKRFGLDALYKKEQPKEGYQGDVAKLKEASSAYSDTKRDIEPVRAALQKQTEGLSFTAPFTKLPTPQALGRQEVDTNHVALQDPNAAPYKSQTSDTSQIVRCKAYIDSSNEKCADFVATAHFDTHTVGVVIDAAGNDPKCFAGAKKAADELIGGLTKIVQEHGNDAGKMKESIATLLEQTHFNQRARIRSDEGSKVTCAFTLRINAEDGRQLLLGGTVGDARILYRHSDGTVENMTPSEFDKPYSDSGGSLGDDKMDTKSQGAFKLFVKEMKTGDYCVLESDGSGDNQEAKTNAVSPKQAYNELQGTKYAVQIANPDALPTRADVWMDKKRDKSQDADLQALHDAYVTMKAAQILENSADPAQAVFDHSSNAPSVRWGAKLQIGLHGLEEEFKATSDAKQKTIADPTYQARIKEITDDLRAEMTKIVAKQRWASPFKELLSLFSPSKRASAINEAVDAMIRNPVGEYKVLTDNADQEKLAARDEAKMRNADVTKAHDQALDAACNTYMTEFIKLAGEIKAAIQMPEAEWNQLLEEQSNHLKQPAEESLRFGHIRSSPLFDFIDKNIGKPDDVGIVVIHAATAKPVSRPAPPSTPPTPPPPSASDRRKSMRADEDIGGWEQQIHVENDEYLI